MKQENICRALLVTFSDGTAGGADTAAVSGVNDLATDAALPTGENAQDAAAQRARAFEDLIKGEYKDLYDARVQETVRRRLGAAKESEARYAAVAPTLALIEELLETSPSDADAIGKRIKGLLEGESASAQKAELDEERCEKRYRAWESEARELAAHYEGFDVERELAQPPFRAMLESGVPMRTAYFAMHADEIMPATLTHAVKTVREQVTRAVANGSLRPTETGLSPSATAPTKPDVSHLSRAQRAAIIRRVERGEKITL